MLALCGPDGEVAAVPLLPKRALTLAKELLDCGVLAVKANWPGVGVSRPEIAPGGPCAAHGRS